jgi:hypothetical protein
MCSSQGRYSWARSRGGRALTAPSERMPVAAKLVVRAERRTSRVTKPPKFSIASRGWLLPGDMRDLTARSRPDSISLDGAVACLQCLQQYLLEAFLFSGSLSRADQPPAAPPRGLSYFRRGIKMRSLADGTTAVRFMPQFWEVLPVTMFVLLFGFTVSVAVVRARQEDIPSVLAILSAFFSAIFARREYRSPVQSRRWRDAVTGNAEPPAVVHSKKRARQRKKVQG